MSTDTVPTGNPGGGRDDATAILGPIERGRASRPRARPPRAHDGCRAAAPRLRRPLGEGPSRVRLPHPDDADRHHRPGRARDRVLHRPRPRHDLRRHLPDGRRVLHRPRLRHARAHPPAVGRPPRDPPSPRGVATAASRASGDRRSRRSSTATTGCTCCTGWSINPIVSVVTWSITIAWTSVALAGTTGWIWQRVHPERRPHLLVERMARRPVRARQRLRVRPRGRRADLRGPARPASSSPRCRSCSAGSRSSTTSIARGVLGAWRSEALEVEVAAALRLARRRRAGRGRVAPTPRAGHPRRTAAATRAPADGPRDASSADSSSDPESAKALARRGARPGPRGARRAAGAVPRVRAADPAGPRPRGRPRVARLAQPRAGRSSRSTSRMPRCPRRSSATRTSSPPSCSRTPRSTPRPPASASGSPRATTGVAGRWIDVWVTDNGRGRRRTRRPGTGSRGSTSACAACGACS